MQPQLGRLFTEADDRIGAPRTVVISDRLWQRLFDGRSDALGQTLTLAGEPTTVIGVMPKEFVFPDVGPDFWAPMQMNVKLRASRTEFPAAGRAAARPTSAPTPRAAELEAVMSRLRAEYPVANRQTSCSMPSRRATSRWRTYGSNCGC